MIDFAKGPNELYIDYLNSLATKPIIVKDLNGTAYITKEGLHFLYDTIYNRDEPGRFVPYLCRKAPICSRKDDYDLDFKRMMGFIV